MEFDKDGIMWIDEFTPGTTKSRPLTKAESETARRVAKQERAAAKLAKAAQRQAMIDRGHVFPRKRTPHQKAKATRKKHNTLIMRDLLRELRERLKRERLERLAKRKAAKRLGIPPLPY
jgi:predicted secreted protein